MNNNMFKPFLIWLDDIRDPYDHKTSWVTQDVHGILWATTPRQFKMLVKTLLTTPYGIVINFDHDLGYIDDSGNEVTGYDLAKWLCNYCLDENYDIPEYYVHSANTIGKENIESYIENFKKHNNNRITKKSELITPIDLNKCNLCGTEIFGGDYCIECMKLNR